MLSRISFKRSWVGDYCSMVFTYMRVHFLGLFYVFHDTKWKKKKTAISLNTVPNYGWSWQTDWDSFLKYLRQNKLKSDTRFNVVPTYSFISLTTSWVDTPSIFKNKGWQCNLSGIVNTDAQLVALQQNL